MTILKYSLASHNPAAAKANTILNYMNVGTDHIKCIFDSSQSKQGKYTPGGAIPILSPENLKVIKPDLVLVFAWNIFSEIESQIKQIIKKDIIILPVDYYSIVEFVNLTLKKL